MTLPMVGLGAALTGGGSAGDEITMSTTCSAAWCQNDRQNPTTSADAMTIIREQLADVGCDTRKRLTDKVAVVNAPSTAAEKARGQHRHDLTVVRVTSFDNAWAQAKAGEVYVVGWCGE
jgi:hypothetical protein